METESDDLKTLEQACQAVFGGVMAISPELYGKALQRVAELCNREVDSSFKTEVRGVLATFDDCSLD